LWSWMQLLNINDILVKKDPKERGRPQTNYA
jgi:hypothetical protein